MPKIKRPVRPTSESKSLPVISPREGRAAGPFWDLYRDGVTQGMLVKFMQCPQKAHFAMHQGLSSAGGGSAALAFGSIVHNALDRMYSSFQQTGTMDSPSLILSQLEERDKVRLRQMPAASPAEYQAMEENYGLAEIILKAYVRRWEGDLAKFRWLALERKFEVPYDPAKLGLDLPPIPIRGKRDGDLRIINDLYLFETKTKGRIEEDSILDTLPYNLQVQLYLMSQRHDYGEWSHGVIYNLIRKPQLRQGVRESMREFLNRVEKDVAARPDHYFIRYSLSIPMAEQKAWLTEFDHIMLQVINWYETAYTYRNQDSCNGRMGRCEYLPLCAGRAMMHEYRRREHVYPELEDEAEVDAE